MEVNKKPSNEEITKYLKQNCLDHPDDQYLGIIYNQEKQEHEFICQKCLVKIFNEGKQNSKIITFEEMAEKYCQKEQEFENKESEHKFQSCYQNLQKKFKEYMIIQDNCLVSMNKIQDQSQKMMTEMQKKVEEKKIVDIDINSNFHQQKGMILQQFSDIIQNPKAKISEEIEKTEYKLQQYQNKLQEIDKFVTKQLQEIDQDNQNEQIKITSIEELKNFKNDQVVGNLIVQLAKTQFDQKNTNKITEIIKRNKDLYCLSLDLEQTQIKLDDVISLSKSIQNLSNLTYLYLYFEKNSHSNYELQAIAIIFSKLPQIKCLHFRNTNNKSGIDGIQSISKSLQCLTHLQELQLYFQNNNIQDGDVQNLFDAIKSLGKLKLLNLNFQQNIISKIGIENVPEVLGKLENLNSLYLNFIDNQLKMEGIKFMLDSVKNFQGDIELNLKSNQVGTPSQIKKLKLLLLDMEINTDNIFI